MDSVSWMPLCLCAHCRGDNNNKGGEALEQDVQRGVGCSVPEDT